LFFNRSVIRPVSFVPKQQQAVEATDDALFTIGYTERQQLMTYLANSHIIDKQSTSYYNEHDVQATEVAIEQINGIPVAIIRLQDVGKALHLASKLPVAPERNNSMSRICGGNSYRSEYSGPQHYQLCTYVDYANDTYDVICKMYDTCADVSISVTYVAFGAYRWDGQFVNVNLFMRRVCNNITAKLRGFKDSAYTGWYRDNITQPLRWIPSYGQELPTDSRMKACLSALPLPVEFVGDSHMRYVFDGIISKKGANNFTSGKLKTQTEFDHFVFTFVGYSANHILDDLLLNDKRGIVPGALKKENNTWTLQQIVQDVQTQLMLWITREKSGVKRLQVRQTLAISFGTWDLMRVNIKYFVTKTIPILRTFLESRRLDVDLSRVKVVLTTIPAAFELPYIDPRYAPVRYDLRNNAMLAAANRLLVETALMFDDVIIADWFSVTVARSSAATDRVHYLKEDTTSLNDVGIAMMRLLVDQMCK
jgi:hypothetical protein